MSACASSVAHVGDLFDAHNEKMAGGKGVSKAKLAGKGGKVKGDVDVPSEEEEAPAVTNQADMGAKEAVADEKSDEQKQMENTSINTLYEEGDKSIARVRWVFGVFLCACACAFGVSTGLWYFQFIFRINFCAVRRLVPRYLQSHMLVKWCVIE